MMLGEKLTEIEAAFHTLGWQSDETFQPVLMALLGEDLEVKPLNRIRSMWDRHEIPDVLDLLYRALVNEPVLVREMILEGEKDVRGLAMMTEGWCVVGTKEEVIREMEQVENAKDHPDRREHRVVMGVLFTDMDLPGPMVWGAQRIRGDLHNTPSVDRGFGGGVSDQFLAIAQEVAKNV